MTLPLFPLNKITHVGFGISFVIILTTLGIAFWGLHRTVDNFESVIRSEEVAEELLRLFVDLGEAEDNHRVYLLTENDRFLEPYQKSVKNTQTRIAELEQLSMKHERLHQEFPILKQLILNRLSVLENVLAKKNSEGNQAAIGLILSGEGMRFMEQIQNRILKFDTDTAAYLTSLHESAYDIKNFTLTTMALGIVLIFLVAMFTLWKLMRDLTERQTLERRLLEDAKLAEVSRRIGDVGHDIKNMLTPVQMGMNLLEEELNEHFQHPNRDGDKIKATQELYKDVIAMTRKGSSRIQERVKEIADAVKGRTPSPQFMACELEKIVDSVLDALRLYADGRGIELRSQGLDGLPIIRADEPRLFNAFYNLVNNAIPEVPAGGFVTITGEVTPDGKEIILNFEDTGRGMAPEVLNSLFTYNVVSHKVGGTGLGTKIVKDVVDLHGGTITVKSMEGQGTTFKIRLPKDGPLGLAA